MTSATFKYTSRTGLFWISQAVWIPILSIVVYGLFHAELELASIPSLNEHPRIIRPIHNYEFVVTDSQLGQVLFKTRPKFPKQQPPKTNFVDHALRQWGITAKFDDGSLSGEQMRQLLLNQETFGAVWGKREYPLLNESKNGIQVTTRQGRSTVSHEDHLLGTLAEIGTPLSFPVRTNNSVAQVGDLLSHAAKTFRLNQREYEWTVLALALYTNDGKPWRSVEGQELNFDRLANRLMRQRQPQGVCYGQHRLYTLTMLLRIDDQMRDTQAGTPLLTDRSRETVLGYLKDQTRRLIQSQASPGYWDGNWANPAIPVSDPRTDELSRQILATGHTLEWWAMAPAELHPPRESIVRAAQWLTKMIVEMDDANVLKNYTFLTHAARSLALWRGIFPAEFEQVRTAKQNQFLKNNKPLNEETKWK